MGPARVGPRRASRAQEDPKTKCLGSFGGQPGSRADTTCYLQRLHTANTHTHTHTARSTAANRFVYTKEGTLCFAQNFISTKCPLVAALLRPPRRLASLARLPPKSSSLYTQQELGHRGPLSSHSSWKRCHFGLNLKLNPLS